MPNLDGRFGLRPRTAPGGTVPLVREMQATTIVIYQGALLQLTTGGLVSAIDATAGPSSYVGVSAQYLAAGTPASTSRVIQVYVDPEQEYLIQSDDGAITVVSDYVGRYGSMISNTAGNTSTLQAQGELNSSYVAATGTTAAPLRVQYLDSAVDNAIAAGSATDSSNANFVVKIDPAKHLFHSAVPA